MNDNPLDTKSLDAGPPPSPFDALFLLSENPNPKATADSKSIAPKPGDQNSQSQTTTLDFTDPIYPSRSSSDNTLASNAKPESPKEGPQPDSKPVNEQQVPVRKDHNEQVTVSMDAYGNEIVTTNGKGPTGHYARIFSPDGKEIEFELFGPDGKVTTKTPDGENSISDPKTGIKVTTDNILASSPIATVIETKDGRETIDKDGVKFYDPSNRELPSVIQKPDGTKTTKYSDGSVMVEKKVDGKDSGYVRHPDKDGGYTETGWGPGLNNYHEKYDPHTRVTTRTDESGTKSLLPDGTRLVLPKDGENIRYNPDGSENHYGKENFDKPAWDYKNDAAVKSARQEMFAAAEPNMPPEAFATFKKDTSDFEARAPKSKIPPEKVAETYENIALLLKSKPDAKGINDSDKGLLSFELMHETAHPDAIKQGHHETCNVTVAGREALTKNPAATTAFLTALALHGEATGPDGAKVKVDRQSLIPGTEEMNYPPAHPQDRSFATQVLNVGLVNYALEKRSPAGSYTQEPFPQSGNDTGERRLDKQGHVIDVLPSVSEYEYSTLTTIFTGDDSPHVIGFNDASPAAISVENPTELKQQLQILKDQGKLPIFVAVDAFHYPIVPKSEEQPGVGDHVVSITDFDPKTGEIKLLNQWDPRYNRTVSVDDLFKNMSGSESGS